jgi:hypothetical protein
VTSVYAEWTDVEARVDSTYAGQLPADTDDQDRLLTKASELISEMTLGRSEWIWTNEELESGESTADMQTAVTRAVCDQIEFWFEVGSEHDVSGLRGSLVGGRLQVHPVSATLAPRAKRTLRNAGVYWEGTAIG